MSAIDTPDYQRGVVSAQKLLAAESANTVTVTVGLPPNCETLIIAVAAGGTQVFPTVTGHTSGVQYPGQVAIDYHAAAVGIAWYYEVSDVVDSQVDINMHAVPGAAWWVYSDSGAHTVVDLGNKRDQNGSQFVVPVIPYPATENHPPWEVSTTSDDSAATVQILPAPGAGKRYRIFSVSMSVITAGLWSVIYDVVANAWLLSCVGVGNATTNFPAQGVPLTLNAALEYGIGGGAGTAAWVVTYTTETA